MRDERVFTLIHVTSSQPEHFFGFRECTVFVISASVIGIIFMLGKFPGNESFRTETASP
jgi:hypothetical protein